jgi:hypothetical protein
MVRRFLVIVLLSCAVLPAAATAREQPDLVVTIRDERGAGVAASVIVRDANGRRDLARAATDSAGAAAFAALPVSDVRVAVEGVLPNGAALAQPGDDARGALLWLSAGTTLLDLRAAPDGLVQPDPATMIAQETISPAPVVFPTAAIAAPEAMPPRAAAPPPEVSLAPLREAARPEAAGAAFPIGGVLVVGALGAAVIVVARFGGRI